jgi:hypothetical protein
MTPGRWLILSLTYLACVAPATAQAKPFSFEDAAAQIVGWSYGDCRPEKVPPPVKAKTSSTGRPWWPFTSGPEEDKGSGAPPPAPKVVNAGFHSDTTKLSKSAQQFIIVKIEQALSQVRLEDGRGILVRNPSDASVSYDYIHDAFGSARGNDIARALEAAHFDFIMRAVGVYTRGGTVVSLHFLLDAPAGGCQKRTLNIEIDAKDLPSDDAPPSAILEQAASELFKQSEAGTPVKRIALLPVTINSVVIDAEANQNLIAPLAAALRKGAPAGSRDIGAAPSRGGGTPVVQVADGVYLDSGLKAGDWLGEIRIIAQHDGSHLAVDFFEVTTGAISSTVGRIDPKYMPKATEPLISFVKDLIKLQVGKDPLQFQVKVHKPASLLCLSQEADGETLLLYPNSRQRGLSGLALRQPRAAPMAYPVKDDLESDLAIENIGVATAFLVRCITAEQWPLDMDLWWEQTPRMRLGRDLSNPAIQGVDFQKLWSSLRKTAGAREILSVVHVAKGE